MRRKTLLNRNVIIVLMLFIFLMTAFVSTAYSFWYFPDESLKTVNTDMKVDDIEENFKDTGSYLKIIDCRDGVIPTDADFAKSESGFLDNSKNFSDNGNTFRGKNHNYSKKVFGVSSSKVNALYKYPLNPTLLNPNPEGEYVLESFVSSVFYGSGTSTTDSGTSTTDMTEIYLYDLLNSQYKLVDHLTNESIELKDGNGTSSDGGNMDKPLLDAEKYSSTKSEAYRKNIGNSFSKSRILFLVPRDTKWINNKQPTPTDQNHKVGIGSDYDYNIYFYNEEPKGKDKYNYYNQLEYVWLWNDRTDFGALLHLNCSDTKEDGKSYKSLHINYRTLYEAYTYNDFNGKDFNCKNKNESGFIMTSQTAPTGIIFKTKDGTNLAPKDDRENTEYLALPLPPKNPTSFDIYINAAKDGKFTIRTEQDVDLTKNKNIVFYSAIGLDHLWTWSSSTSGVDRWISSNYVYKFNMTGCNKPVSCFSYNYGEKFNFYKNWKGPADTSAAQFSSGFTFDKNEEGKKINYNYNQLVLTDYNISSQTGDIDISGLFKDASENDTSECTSVYLIVKNDGTLIPPCTSRDDFIKALNDLN